MSGIRHSMSEEINSSLVEPTDAPVPGDDTLPPCCRSGCTVCVLDHPELFREVATGAPDEGRGLASPRLETLLEAIEQAECLVAEIRRLELFNPNAVGERKP